LWLILKHSNSLFELWTNTRARSRSLDRVIFEDRFFLEDLSSTAKPGRFSLSDIDAVLIHFAGELGDYPTPPTTTYSRSFLTRRSFLTSVFSGSLLARREDLIALPDKVTLHSLVTPGPCIFEETIKSLKSPSLIS
jgi:hypothetical protein